MRNISDKSVWTKAELMTYVQQSLVYFNPFGHPFLGQMLNMANAAVESQFQAIGNPEIIDSQTARSIHAVAMQYAWDVAT